MALPDGWFRTTPDSSVLDRPRLFVRRFVAPEELQAAVADYARLLGVEPDFDMPWPEAGLEIVGVGNVLLIAHRDDLPPAVTDTTFTVLVPSAAAHVETVVAAGGEVLDASKPVPAGSGARVRYPDGALVEVVEHRPLHDES